MTQQTRLRPRSLSGLTTVLTTARGNLYLTVSVDESGQPFEVFGQIGKAGAFEKGVTEMACRLVSLHLRRGTPVAEIVAQCEGIQEMQPWTNMLPNGSSGWVLGISDAISHVLRPFAEGNGANAQQAA
ncbi:MAG: hypothetical protein F4X20_04765 [Dehalococcoidia bacterium]|nr:hypothetical protein [Dehalococcoidia bacterium]